MPSPFNKISPSKPSNVNSALIKEAAANVDVRAMGDKGIFVIYLFIICIINL